MRLLDDHIHRECQLREKVEGRQGNALARRVRQIGEPAERALAPLRALETQLCGQYLRHREARHGILLLVHQKTRSGWRFALGQPLVSFAQVVEHLEAKARAIRETATTGPQPIVVAIDVSAIRPLKERRAIARARTAARKAV